MNIIITRTLIFISLLICITDANARIKKIPANFILPEIYFDRQPSTKAEAMGKTLTTVEDGMFSVHYNPANILYLDGLTVSTSYSTQRNTASKQPIGEKNKVEYYFWGIGYRLFKKMTIGISENKYKLSSDSYGLDFPIYSANRSYSKHMKTEIQHSISRLTIAANIFKNVSIGVNLNYIENGAIDDECFGVDLGMNYTWLLCNETSNSHTLNIASNVQNINNPMFNEHGSNYIHIYSELPQVANYAINYTYNYINSDKFIFKKLSEQIQILFNVEYQHLLNADYRKGFHFGTELTFYDILSMRAGYYDEKNGFEKDNDLSNFTNAALDWNISEFTYGLGLVIPLQKLNISKTPIDITFDFATLKQADMDRLEYYNNAFSYSLTVKFYDL